MPTRSTIFLWQQNYAPKTNNYYKCCGIFFEDNSNEMNERTKNGLVYVALYGKFLTRQRENFVIRSNIGIDIWFCFLIPTSFYF